MADYSSDYRSHSDRVRARGYDGLHNPDLLPNDSDDETHLSTNVSTSKRGKPMREIHTYAERQEALKERVEEQIFDENIDRASKSIKVTPIPTVKSSGTEKKDQPRPMFAPSIENEPDALCEKRVAAYKSRQQSILSTCTEILEDNQKGSMKFVIDFVDRVFDPAHRLDPDIKEINFGVIPAAWVVLGVSGQDSTLSFSHLLQDVQKKKHTLVVHLMPSDAPSEKKLFKTLFFQILGKTPQPSFEDLLRWSKTKDVKPKIVVGIDKAEQFPPNVLVNFLQVITKYAADLKLVLIFGVIASLETLKSQMPRNLVGNLSPHVFKLNSSAKAFEKLVSRTFIDGLFGYDVGWNLFHFHESFFQTYTSSIVAFQHRLKYMTLEFYSSRPFSWVAHACNDSLDEAQKALVEMANTNIYREEVLRYIFQNVVQKGPEANKQYGLDEGTVTELVQSPEKLNNFIIKKGIEAFSHRLGFRASVKCLHLLLKQTFQENSPSIVQVFSSVLSKDPVLEEWLKWGTIISRHDAEILLRQWHDVFAEYPALKQMIDDSIMLADRLMETTKQITQKVRPSDTTALSQSRLFISKILRIFLLPDVTNIMQEMIFFYDEVQPLQMAFAADLHADITTAYNSMLRFLKKQGKATDVALAGQRRRPSRNRGK